MRILEMHAINYKGIVDVTITPGPDQNVILITGKNGQGKTSAIDAIWAALKGAEVSKFTSKPRRDGEKHASVRLDLGEYIVLREWDKDDIGRLTITTPRGAAYPSPQKLLDGLVAKLTMDPLAFARQKGEDQIKTLVEMLGDALGFDPDEIEKRRVDADAERAAANKVVASMQARFDSAPAVPDDIPDVFVSTVDILTEHAAAQALNTKRTESFEDIDSLRSELVDAEEALAKAKEHRATVLTELKDAEKDALALPPAVDLQEIMVRLGTVEQTNMAVRAKHERAALASDLALAVATAKRYDDTLTAIKKEKQDALAAVEFPVEGMTFDLETKTVLVNGIPMSQMSGKERRTVSLDMAAAMKPELRIVRVDEGESFDEDALADIYTWAGEKDFQVWMTKVGASDDSSAVVIHEGEVVA